MALVFIIPIKILAQPFNESAFLNALPQAQNDSNKVNSLNFYGKYLIRTNNYERALQYSDSALRFAKKLKFDKGEIQACENISFIYYSYNEYAKALEYDRKKLEKYKQQKNTKGTSNSYRAIGTLYFYLNNMDSAICYYHFALNDYRQNSNRAEAASVLGGLGYFYTLKKDYNKALHFAKEAQAILEELNDRESLIAILKNLINIHNEMGNNLEAKGFEEKLVFLKKDSRAG